MSYVLELVRILTPVGRCGSRAVVVVFAFVEAFVVAFVVALVVVLAD